MNHVLLNPSLLEKNPDLMCFADLLYLDVVRFLPPNSRPISNKAFASAERWLGDRCLKTIEEVFAMQTDAVLLLRGGKGTSRRYMASSGANLMSCVFLQISDGSQHGKSPIPILGLLIVGKIRRYDIGLLAQHVQSIHV